MQLRERRAQRFNIDRRILVKVPGRLIGRGVKCQPRIARQGGVGDEIIAKAVSYTHLDVYKRQD